MTKRELTLLHNLQCNLALKRDWVAVAHLQALIDRISDEHGGFDAQSCEANLSVAIH